MKYRRPPPHPSSAAVSVALSIDTSAFPDDAPSSPSPSLSDMSFSSATSASSTASNVRRLFKKKSFLKPA
eukprot:CAMPEP_0194338068 /NCGR_PEP_ID=MMETSP0171-20130528/78302_1 /TAXON_ID=218684 /ORGANISM="Corethron pennatum, Strain L29A3" /LENGTH=69 /DNA_ID=CAMNT_0039102067 /DNA_START=454 /DNA_END=659 /DNA_ORIENTATION=+